VDAIKSGYLIFPLIVGLWCLSTKGQTPSPSPEEHFSGVNTRGDEAMGFSHEKTTHHFHLFTDGGSIEIASNDPSDTETQKAIRDHLRRRTPLPEPASLTNL
jgi:hypothetical protein